MAGDYDLYREDIHRIFGFLAAYLLLAGLVFGISYHYIQKRCYGVRRLPEADVTTDKIVDSAPS